MVIDHLLTGMILQVGSSKTKFFPLGSIGNPGSMDHPKDQPLCFWATGLPDFSKCNSNLRVYGKESSPFAGDIDSLAGGFKYFLCSPLPGEMIQFD